MSKIEICKSKFNNQFFTTVILLIALLYFEAPVLAQKKPIINTAKQDFTTCKIEYPRSSLRNEETGTTTVEVALDQDGNSTEITVLKSSGFRNLDNAVLKAFETCIFSPQIVKGKRVASVLKVAYVFSLEGSIATKSTPEVTPLGNSKDDTNQAKATKSISSTALTNERDKNRVTTDSSKSLAQNQVDTSKAITSAEPLQHALVRPLEKGNIKRTDENNENLLENPTEKYFYDRAKSVCASELDAEIRAVKNFCQIEDCYNVQKQIDGLRYRFESRMRQKLIYTYHFLNGESDLTTTTMRLSKEIENDEQGLVLQDEAARTMKRPRPQLIEKDKAEIRSAICAGKFLQKYIADAPLSPKLIKEADEIANKAISMTTQSKADHSSRFKMTENNGSAPQVKTKTVDDSRPEYKKAPKSKVQYLHDPLALANHCVSLDPNLRLYGGFKNSCNEKVTYTYCVYKPKKNSWGELFDCEGDMAKKPQIGALTIKALDSDSEHTNGGLRVHWFACFHGAVPKEVTFNGVEIRGKCIHE
ncbi:energy transducer TonB [Undibacterium danionis]|uniref:Energy transducer TonB n=1 Tax=Undibacterium danionis TaxID=1812100 RepID=A0ABV6IIY1_9BURK